MPNLVNAERISVAFGTRTLLEEVSLGLGRGDVVGVVGRNGDGKTTLLQVLTGVREPDAGRVVRTGATSVGYLRQAAAATGRRGARAGGAGRVVAGRPRPAGAGRADKPPRCRGGGLARRRA